MSTPHDLATRLKAARQRQRKVSLIVTLALVATSLLFVVSLYFSYSRFVSDGLSPTIEKTKDKLLVKAPRYAELGAESVRRLYPVYSTVFWDHFVQEWPKAEQDAKGQMAELEKFFHAQWPGFEAEMDRYFKEQHDTVLKELQQVVGPDRATAIINNYSELGTELLQRVAMRFMGADHSLLNELQHNFQQLTLKEQGNSGRVQPEEAVGLFFELVGVEFQAMAEDLKETSADTQFRPVRVLDATVLNH